MDVPARYFPPIVPFQARVWRCKVKPFSTVGALVFALVAVLQLLRFLSRWEVVINGMSVPFWASAIAFLVAAVLAVTIWREAHR